MSGTNHNKAEAWAGPQPAFVLVNPQMGENIGAAARAMWNFGLDRMRLVAPRDGWPNPKAVAMASGAGQVLDHVGLHADTGAAIADMNYVFATTARNRDLTKPVMSPERAMAHARGLIAEGQTVAVLFGPERAGLQNEDIVRANALISVPVNSAFASLNLAQCVLLTAYEWGRQHAGFPERDGTEGADPATQSEVEKLAEHFETHLDASGFFHPPEKAAHMRRNLRNLWSRMPLMRGDVQILHGVLRQLVRRTGQEDQRP